MEAAWRKSWAPGPCAAWTLGTFRRETLPYLEGPRCRTAPEMVAVACSSAPGRCLTAAASAQEFIAGELDYPTYSPG